MTTLVAVLVVVMTVTSAVRSTWSPCGLSMLSTITPIAEHGRGHHYWSTVAWFVAGATVGGATLGLVMALGAAGFGALGATSAWTAVLLAVAGMVAALSDARVGGRSLPIHHRQVNERWLDQFRPWVYASGFGWQIGTGLGTYIMTAGVYLVIVAGVLTGRPLAALALGTAFGLVRGLCVLLGCRIASPSALLAFHRRFLALSPVSRRLAVAGELGVALGAVVSLSALAGTVGAIAVAVVVLAIVVRRHSSLGPRALRPSAVGAP